MQTLKQYGKAQGATGHKKVEGINGAFIAFTKLEVGNPLRFKKEDPTQFTIPVGKKSQTAKLDDYRILIASDGQAIATVNSYTVAETCSSYDEDESVALETSTNGARAIN